MKKYFTSFALLIIAISLISWGSAGHKTVATIAYNHLTPKAKVAVKALLGDQSMADVASWADEVLRQPEYKHTASWHYVNAPLGLSYNDFSKEVIGQSQENVYSALVANEKLLSSTTSTNEQKTEALKFIIHFVGDLHQPMHVSRKEDKGGNTIQLQYEGRVEILMNQTTLFRGKLTTNSGAN